MVVLKISILFYKTFRENVLQKQLVTAFMVYMALSAAILTRQL